MVFQQTFSNEDLRGPVWAVGYLQVTNGPDRSHFILYHVPQLYVHVYIYYSSFKYFNSFDHYTASWFPSTVKNN